MAGTPSKLKATATEVGGDSEAYVADLSRVADVEAMATQILEQHSHLDVLINNAGVLKTPHPTTPEGLDVRFVVNTLAPYVLTRRLLPIIQTTGRIVNYHRPRRHEWMSMPWAGRSKLEDDMGAYAQSKLAITIWSRELAKGVNWGARSRGSKPGIASGVEDGERRIWRGRQRPEDRRRKSYAEPH